MAALMVSGRHMRVAGFAGCAYFLSTVSHGLMIDLAGASRSKLALHLAQPRRGHEEAHAPLVAKFRNYTTLVNAKNAVSDRKAEARPSYTGFYGDDSVG
jgi:hypothetical protein